jgi:hypothetical protein
VARAWRAELDEAIAHKGFAFQAVAADYELVNLGMLECLLVYGYFIEGSYDKRTNLKLSEFFSHTPLES